MSITDSREHGTMSTDEAVREPLHLTWAEPFTGKDKPADAVWVNDLMTGDMLSMARTMILAVAKHGDLVTALMENGDTIAWHKSRFVFTARVSQKAYLAAVTDRPARTARVVAEVVMGDSIAYIYDDDDDVDQAIAACLQDARAQHCRVQVRRWDMDSTAQYHHAVRLLAESAQRMSDAELDHYAHVAHMDPDPTRHFTVSRGEALHQMAKGLI